MTLETRSLGHLLHQDHLQTIEILNRLEARTTGRQAGRPLSAADAGDRALAEATIALVKREVIDHFAFEETHLFPILSELGGGDMVLMLIHEHVHIGGIAHRLSVMSGTFLQDQTCSPEEWREFCSVAGDFLQASLFHIQKEEMGVVQRLPVFLDVETDAELVRRHAAMRAAET